MEKLKKKNSLEIWRKKKKHIKGVYQMNDNKHTKKKKKKRVLWYKIGFVFKLKSIGKQSHEL